jgi:hypothetical protein
MQLSPWEAISHWSAEEFPSILWNPKFHYRVHNSMPLVPFLCQISLVHTTLSYFCKIHLNIILPPTSKSFFSFDFPTKTLHTLLLFPFLLHAMPISSLCTPPFNYLWRRVQVMKLLITQFCRANMYWKDELCNKCDICLQAEPGQYCARASVYMCRIWEIQDSISCTETDCLDWNLSWVSGLPRRILQ